MKIFSGFKFISVKVANFLLNIAKKPIHLYKKTAKRAPQATYVSTTILGIWLFGIISIKLGWELLGTLTIVAILMAFFYALLRGVWFLIKTVFVRTKRDIKKMLSYHPATIRFFKGNFYIDAEMKDVADEIGEKLKLIRDLIKIIFMRFLSRWFPRLFFRLKAKTQDVLPEKIDAAQFLLGNADRIDLFPNDSQNGRGFKLVLDKKLALFFYQDGDTFYYDGFEMGEYEEGNVTILDSLPEEKKGQEFRKLEREDPETSST